MAGENPNGLEKKKRSSPPALLKSSPPLPLKGLYSATKLLLSLAGILISLAGILIRSTLLRDWEMLQHFVEAPTYKEGMTGY